MMKKNVYASIMFIVMFGHAKSQDTLALNKYDDEDVKTEKKLHAGAELQMAITTNLSETGKGLHADLMPAACYGANLDYGRFSVSAHGLSCFTSIPMPVQQFKLLTGELCFGASVKENDNNKTTIKVGKFSFAGKYGLAAHKNQSVSTDVAYDMFKLNNDRALNRGVALMQNSGPLNFALGYTEQDGNGGFKFDGNNQNVVASAGYDSKVLSAQFVYFYSIKTNTGELSCYVMCNPNEKNMLIIKALGLASENPIFEVMYAHEFQKLTFSIVAFAGKNQFASVDVAFIFPCNISVNIGLVNNDPYFEKQGLNPKIGVGYHYVLPDLKTR